MFIIIFRNRRKKKVEPKEITLRNKIKPNKESTQFLGMTLDSKLNWEKHIERVGAKAKRALNTIKVVASKKWEGCCRSLKDCNVWYVDLRWIMIANCTVQPPQKDLKKHLESPVESLYAETCGPTMELRHDLGLRFLYRLRRYSTYTVTLHTLDLREDQNYVWKKEQQNQQEYT